MPDRGSHRDSDSVLHRQKIRNEGCEALFFTGKDGQAEVSEGIKKAGYSDVYTDVQTYALNYYLTTHAKLKPQKSQFIVIDRHYLL